MDLDLQDKRALVTGSSSGIGAEIARTLAREGVRVVVHGRRPDETRRVALSIRDAGGVAVPTTGDLATDAGAGEVARAAQDAFGGIDILVNNAGAAPLAGWFDDGGPDLWSALHDLNVVSAVRMIRAFVPAMRERGWGRVVNLGSVVASMPLADNPHYHATKAANVNQAVSLAKALAGSGVTVNAVSPGLIRTPATEPWMRHWAREHGWSDDWDTIESNTARLVSPNPSGRVGKPADVAYAVAVLASPRSGFINGANLRVDGGANPTIN